MRFFWKLYLYFTGWKAAGSFPHQLQKAIVIVGPHTSNRDFIIGLAFRSVLKLSYIKFLGKEELFRGPFGFVFRWLGGTPVDRFNPHHLVDQVVEQFNSRESFVLALSPEGTRKKVDRLRTGFYHIARKAKVPVIMVAFDYPSRQLVIDQPFFTTDNEEADLKRVIQFFGSVQGCDPEQDMRHLLKKEQ